MTHEEKVSRMTEMMAKFIGFTGKKLQTNAMPRDKVTVNKKIPKNGASNTVSNVIRRKSTSVIISTKNNLTNENRKKE